MSDIGSGASVRAGSVDGLAVRLRPAPDREPLVAAGAVLLAMAALVIDLRMTQWALGPKFLVLLVISAVILGLGWSALPGGVVARPYQSMLLIAGLILLIFTLELLAEVLGAHHSPGAGGTFWTFAAEAGVAFVSARRSRSAGCTLIGALASAISILAFIGFAFHPHGLTAVRWIILVESLVFVVGAVRLRAAHPRHATQFVNVAGILALLVSLTFLATTALTVVESRLGTAVPLSGVGPTGFGWKLYTLIAAGALIAYAVIGRAPAPGVLGILVSFTFVALVGFPSYTGGSLVFWPLFLLIVGAAAVLFGLGAGRRVAGGQPSSGVPPSGGAPPSAPRPETASPGPSPPETASPGASPGAMPPAAPPPAAPPATSTPPPSPEPPVDPPPREPDAQ